MTDGATDDMERLRQENAVLSRCAEEAEAERDAARQDNAHLREVLKQVRTYAIKGCSAPNAAYRWCERIDEIAHDVLSETADASPWRPISTAPKNQEVLVLTKQGAVFRAEFVWADDLIGVAWTINPDHYWIDAESADYEYPDGTNLCYESHPTHWMPLPESPKEESDE